MKAKYFLVHFTADGMEPLVAVGLTRSLVARTMKRQYGNRAIKKVVPTSRDGSVGYGHAPSSWASMSPLSGTNPFMREGKIQEAGYLDTPKDKEELKKRHPNVKTDVKNKDSKDLVMPAMNEKELTPAELKKREEIAQAIERDNPSMDKSKKMAIATAKAKEVAESMLDEAKQLKNMTDAELQQMYDEINKQINAKGGVSSGHPLAQKLRILRGAIAFRKAGIGRKGRKEETELEEALDSKTNHVIEAMSTLLGTSYTLQAKVQNFHWNIQGPDFIQYHTYLGELYDLIAGHVDKIAEQIRTMDAKAPAGLAKFLELSEIEEATDTPGALEMMSAIQQDVEILIATLEEANDEAERAGKTGLANYLQDTIDQFSKQNWFLKSIQGRSLQESTIKTMVTEAAMKLEGQLVKKHRIEGTLKKKPKLEGTLKGVKINPDSPDANGDGTVDDKDDLNGDGVVDSKDLLIAQLEKDVRIRELQARLEELDDPVPEAQVEEAPDMPIRLRIKDRGTHFEAIDEMGNCVQEFPYDNKEMYAQDARYKAQRFAEKHWAEACGRMKREQVMKSGTTMEKKKVKLREFASALISKKSVREEVGISMSNEVEKGFIVHYIDRDGNNGEELVKASGPGVAYRAYQNKALENGYRVVDVTYDGKSMIDAARRETFRRRVAEEIENKLSEGNAFVFAAIKARKAGKKTFKFNGKTYKVTLREEIEMANIFEELDDRKLMTLAKQGLVDQEQIAVFKQALGAINDGKPLLPKQRETMLAAFSKLANMVSGDTTLFNKARKMVKEAEEVEDVAEGVVQLYKVTYDIYGNNREKPLYTKTRTVRAKSEKEAIDILRKLVGGTNYRVEKQGVAEQEDPCWDDYQMVGMKDKGGKKVPNCVPEETELKESKQKLKVGDTINFTSKLFGNITVTVISHLGGTEWIVQNPKTGKIVFNTRGQKFDIMSEQVEESISNVYSSYIKFTKR